MAAPTYRIEEITRRTGFTARSVRYYVERGLLPGTEQRGVATVYTHEQLLRLQAIALLRTRERLRLEAVKRRLAKMSLADLEALVASIAGPPAPPASVPAGAPGAAADAAMPATFVRWDRAELLPGLEIAVRSDAAPVVRRLAEEIFAKYGAAAPSPAGA
jgi:DNA-binding transcriptional MerR regulator